MSGSEVAIVVGVGTGLGNALVRRFAEAGMRVAAVSRTGRGLGTEENRERVRGYACDATIGDQVAAMMAQVASDLGPPDLVVFNVGTWDRGSILDITEALFER